MKQRRRVQASRGFILLWSYSDGYKTPHFNFFVGRRFAADGELDTKKIKKVEFCNHLNVHNYIH